MAVTKLNASAPPYHSTSYHRTTPPAYMKVYQYQCHFHAAPAGSLPFPVVVASRSFVPLLVPAPHPTYSLPPPLGATVPVLFKAPPVHPSCNAAPLPPVSISCNTAPLPPPLRHGSPPHKLMEVQVQAAAKVQAAVLTVKPGQEPAPTTGPHRRGREAQQRTSGVSGRRRRVEPVGVRAKPARSPSPMFTTRPPSPLVPAPEWFEQPVTTVMIRNIPIKLTPGEMMRLLDDHCARANRNKKLGGGDSVLSAYDFLYLRMDFRLRCNMGYAFVNLTTAEAARGLYYALHGSRWKVFASKKVIEVCPARIQGKDAQVRHLRGGTFACDTDEFLPAVFSPPRHGATGPCSLKRVGRRDPHPPLAVAGRRVPPPAVRLALPPRQAWRPIAS